MQAVENLCSAVSSVVRLYEAAGEDMDTPNFVASINLDQIREADAVLDQELEKLMENYFDKVIHLFNFCLRSRLNFLNRKGARWSRWRRCEAGTALSTRG